MKNRIIENHEIANCLNCDESPVSKMTLNGIAIHCPTCGQGVTHLFDSKQCTANLNNLNSDFSSYRQA